MTTFGDLSHAAIGSKYLQKNSLTAITANSIKIIIRQNSICRKEYFPQQWVSHYDVYRVYISPTGQTCSALTHREFFRQNRCIFQSQPITV